MYNVSFGKISPQAEAAANSQIQGMMIAAKITNDENTYEKAWGEKVLLEHTKNDPNYYFDKNPEQHTIIDENGQPKFNTEYSYTIYKTAKDNDKYFYLGKCKFLSDGYKLTDKIDLITQHHKEAGDSFPGAYKHIGVALLNTDKSISHDVAMERAKKILDLEG